MACSTVRERQKRPSGWNGYAAGGEARWGLPLTPSEGWTLPEGAQVQCPRGVLAIRGKRHSKRYRLCAISRDFCASVCCAPVCARRARSREWARLRENSCAARAPWIAGPTNHGVARCMDSIPERMRRKQSKCLAIRPPGGHIFQCVPLTGLGARMAACWRPGELPSGGAAVEVLSTAIVFQTGTASLQTAAGVLL